MSTNSLTTEVCMSWRLIQGPYFTPIWWMEFIYISPSRILEMPLICVLGTQDLHWATIFYVSSSSYFFPFFDETADWSIMDHMFNFRFVCGILSAFSSITDKNTQKIKLKGRNNIYKFFSPKKSWRLLQGPNYIPICLMEPFSTHLRVWEYWKRKILEIFQRCHLWTKYLEDNLLCTLFL